MYSTTSSQSSEGIRISASGIQRLEPVGFPSMPASLPQPIRQPNYTASNQGSGFLQDRAEKKSNLMFLQDLKQK